MIMRKEKGMGMLYYEKDRRYVFISTLTYYTLEAYFQKNIRRPQDLLKYLASKKIETRNFDVEKFHNFVRMIEKTIKEDNGFKIRETEVSNYYKLDKLGIVYLNAPVSVFWTFTNACNLHCTHCAWSSGRASPNELSTEECCDIIDDLCKMGVIELSFSGGEPLVKKNQLFEMAHYGKCKGFKLGLATNAISINQKTSEIISELFDTVDVSFEGMETTEKIRGRGILEKIFRGVKHLQDEGVRVTFNVAANKANLNEIDDIVSKAKDVGVSFIRFVRFIPIGRGEKFKDLFYLTPEMEYKLALKIFSLHRKNKGLISIGTTRLYTELGLKNSKEDIIYQKHLSSPSEIWDCDSARDRICILPEGGVAPCPLLGSLGISGGNLRTERMQDVWHKSELFSELRLGKRIKGNQCKNCDKWNLCKGGCKAASFCLYGDLYAPDPLCEYFKKSA